MAIADAPDWGSVPSSARYLGVLTLANGSPNGTLPFAPADYDQAVLVIPDVIPAGASQFSAFIDCPAPNVVTAEAEYIASTGLGELYNLVGPVSNKVAAAWEVQGQITAPGVWTAHLYCFALPSIALIPSGLLTGPVTVVTNANLEPLRVNVVEPIGQLVAAGSVSVVEASDSRLLIPDDATVLTANLVTTNQTVINQRLGAARGLMVGLNVTVNPGGGQTLQVRVLSSQTTGNVRVINLGVMTGAAGGQQFGVIHPGITAADYDPTLVTQVRNAAPPETFGLIVAPSGAGAWSYTLTTHPLV